MSESTKTLVDGAAMRAVLGHFCTGVVVVTTTTPEGAPAGFTAQSFTSLSLDPPLVSVCVAKTSSSYPVVRAAGRFCVNVLGEHQEALSGQFASRAPDRFAGVEHAPTPVTGSPRLATSLAWVDCTLEAEHDAGDHLIVVGRVVDLAAGEPHRPLLFFRGAYSRIHPGGGG